VPPSLIAMNEPGELLDFGLPNAFSPRVTIPVILSCAFGLSISYFGFLCRKAVSATAYTGELKLLDCVSNCWYRIISCTRRGHLLTVCSQSFLFFSFFFFFFFMQSLASQTSLLRFL